MILVYESQEKEEVKNMYIEQIRHATITITFREYKILVDPMFSKRGTMYSLKIGELFKLRKSNPMVDLPDNMEERLDGVTHALITHNHFDHIDEPAIEYLKKHNISVFCAEDDEVAFRKKGLKTLPLKKGRENIFLDGRIKLIPCRHGWGWIAKAMEHGVGYLIEMPDEPTLYIAGDTVLTDEVKSTITDLKPKWIILAAGKAKLGIGQPLLMSEDEILESVELCSGRVILNHMEAMDHCLIDRKMLREIMRKNKLENKTIIPNDGDTIECN